MDELVGGVQHRPGRREDAGVVHDDVDHPVTCGGVERRLDLAGFGDVTANAGGAEPRCHLGDVGCDVADGDGGTGLDEPTCDRRADAVGAARDERSSATEIDQVGESRVG